jgi:Rrf2 family protein
MAVNVQFSIGVHILAALGYDPGKGAISSELAMSVNTSPSFLRRTLSKLAKAGLVETCTGKGGSCRLAKAPAKISLLDVYEAVDAAKVFAIHSYPNKKACPVSCHIKAALERALRKTQRGMEATLAEITVADVIRDIKG